MLLRGLIAGRVTTGMGGAAEMERFPVKVSRCRPSTSPRRRPQSVNTRSIGSEGPPPAANIRISSKEKTRGGRVVPRARGSLARTLCDHASQRTLLNPNETVRLPSRACQRPILAAAAATASFANPAMTTAAVTTNSLARVVQIIQTPPRAFCLDQRMTRSRFRCLSLPQGLERAALPVSARRAPGR